MLHCPGHGNLPTRPSHFQMFLFFEIFPNLIPRFGEGWVGRAGVREGFGKGLGRVRDGLGKDWERIREGLGKDWGRVREGLGKDWGRVRTR